MLDLGKLEGKRIGLEQKHMTWIIEQEKGGEK